MQTAREANATERMIFGGEGPGVIMEKRDGESRRIEDASDGVDGEMAEKGRRMGDELMRKSGKRERDERVREAEGGKKSRPERSQQPTVRSSLRRANIDWYSLIQY